LNEALVFLQKSSQTQDEESIITMLLLYVFLSSSTIVDEKCPSSAQDQLLYWARVVHKIDKRSINTSQFFKLDCLQRYFPYEMYESISDFMNSILTEIRTHGDLSRVFKGVFDEETKEYGLILNGDLKVSDFSRLIGIDYENIKLNFGSLLKEKRSSLETLFSSFELEPKAFFDKFNSSPDTIIMNDIYRMFPRINNTLITRLKSIGTLLSGNSISYSSFVESMPILHSESIDTLIDSLLKVFVKEDLSFENLIDIAIDSLNFSVSVSSSAMNIIADSLIRSFETIYSYLSIYQRTSLHDRIRTIIKSLSDLFDPKQRPTFVQSLIDLENGEFKAKEFIQSVIGETVIEGISIFSSIFKSKSISDFNKNFNIEVLNHTINEVQTLIDIIFNESISFEEVFNHLNHIINVSSIRSFFDNGKQIIIDLLDENKSIDVVLGYENLSIIVQSLCVSFLNKSFELIPLESLKNISLAFNTSTTFFEFIHIGFGFDMKEFVTLIQPTLEKTISYCNIIIDEFGTSKSEFWDYATQVLRMMGEFNTILKEGNITTQSILSIVFSEPEQVYSLIKNLFTLIYVSAGTDLESLLVNLDPTFFDVLSTVQSISKLETISIIKVLQSIKTKKDTPNGIIKKILHQDIIDLLQVDSIIQVFKSIHDDLIENKIGWGTFISLAPKTITEFIPSLFSRTLNLKFFDFPSFIQSIACLNNTKYIITLGSFSESIMNNKLSLDLVEQVIGITAEEIKPVPVPIPITSSSSSTSSNPSTQNQEQNSPSNTKAKPINNLILIIGGGVCVLGIALMVVLRRRNNDQLLPKESTIQLQIL